MVIQYFYLIFDIFCDHILKHLNFIFSSSGLWRESDWSNTKLYGKLQKCCLISGHECCCSHNLVFQWHVKALAHDGEGLFTSSSIILIRTIHFPGKSSMFLIAILEKLLSGKNMTFLNSNRHFGMQYSGLNCQKIKEVWIKNIRTIISVSGGKQLIKT